MHELISVSLDISVSTVKKMETGEYNISLDTQRKIKNTFDNVSMEYLLFGERKGINDLWAQILVLDEWEKLVLFNRLFAHFGFDDKSIANRDIDEERLRRLIKYLKESFKD